MAPFIRMSTAVIAGCFLAACGGGPEPKYMRAQFSSLPECLASIEQETGRIPKTVTDEPDNVSGFLSGDTSLTFSCKLKSTGTKGVYWESFHRVD